MKVLASALACSPALGSESLVAYQALQALSENFQTECITSAAMRPPNGVRSCSIDVQFDEPNDVGPAQLLSYEYRQRSLVDRLLRESRYDILHRMTPSGNKQSLLKVPPVPLVLGPLLRSDPPPPAFTSIFSPRLPDAFSPSAIRRRFANGVSRRLLEWFSTAEELLENAALILVGTEVTRRKLPERLQSRCRLLTYAGVEHDRFMPPSGRRSGKPPQLLFAGRLVPYKGIELLLRAAAVARKRSRFQLTIVGRGFPPYERYYRELAAKLRLTDSLTFLEHVPREDLVAMYQAADVFCMPSIETYGVAILEAMSSGCAGIVADANGPGEIVQPGTGVKVRLETPEQFVNDYANEIVRLVEDGAFRRQLGERAREHVLRHHDWARIRTSLLEIYREVFFPSSASKGASPAPTPVGST
ncbi:MAG TPA: glycosyltransferase family 4 protein [Planctomycetaceae bacterium]|nr:glycosyltransferase family 4 protein [Planctomycetaceae bacterium]